MARTLFVCALLAAVPSVALAQPAPEPTETVVRLTVQPMAAPKPALKYVLLPEIKDMEPGNPVLGYLKCFSEQQNFWFRKDAVENREKWQEVPLRDLPLEEVRKYGYLNGPLHRADQAARLTNLDWQVLLPARREGSELLLPEIQGLRNLGGALKVRFRVEVAQHRYADAVVTGQTMFALSRHLGEHPAVICSLVGLAVANLATGPLEEMAQQPGSPNLYWALTNLPTPIVSIRQGLQGERMLVDPEFSGIDPVAPMSEAALQKVVARLAHMLKDYPKLDVRAWLEERARDEKYVGAARKRLAEVGLDEGRLQGLPPLQVVLLDEKREYEVLGDDLKKWMLLPYWQAEAHLPAASSSTFDGLGAKLVPWFSKVARAQARVQQRLDLIRHVEALRLYAADHDGKLPAHLSDIPVPLPVDPVTGKPFVYEVDGQTAVLRGSPPKGEEKNPVFNVRFVVTMKK
jgi:hypothetical protein